MIRAGRMRRGGMETRQKKKAKERQSKIDKERELKWHFWSSILKRLLEAFHSKSTIHFRGGKWC